MWSLLGSLVSDIPASFHYSIEDLEDELPFSVFQLHRARHKTTKAEASIFAFSKQRDKKHVDFATRALKNAKSLRHPSFVQVLDVCETSSNLYIATEPVISFTSLFTQTRFQVGATTSKKDVKTCKEEGKLHAARLKRSTYTAARLFNDCLPWNLRLMAEGLAFLHDRANLAHSTLCPGVLFVTRENEYKFGPVEVSCNPVEEANAATRDRRRHELIQNHPLRILYEPGPSAVYASSAHAFGSVMNDLRGYAGIAAYLDVLAQHLVNANANANANANDAALQAASVCDWGLAKNSRNVRPALRTLVTKLTDDTHTGRKFRWDKMLTTFPYFLKSPLVQSLDFFRSAALKNGFEKETFVNETLDKELATDAYAIETQIVCVLPRLAVWLLSPDTESYLFNLVLSKYLIIVCRVRDKGVWDHFVWPSFLPLLKMKERNVRYALLQVTERWEKFLDEGQALETVEDVALGLSDQGSAELRDETLKCMLFYVPKTARGNKNVTSKVIDILAQLLQNDPNDQIRTNAVVCFSRLLDAAGDDEFLKTTIAPRLLLALKDRHALCRRAGVKALAAAAEMFPTAYLTDQLLPCLAPRLNDSDAVTGASAFQAMHKALQILATRLAFPNPSTLSPPTLLPTETNSYTGTKSYTETKHQIESRSHQIEPKARSGENSDFEDPFDFSAQSDAKGVDLQVLELPSPPLYSHLQTALSGPGTLAASVERIKGLDSVSAEISLMGKLESPDSRSKSASTLASVSARKYPSEPQDRPVDLSQKVAEHASGFWDDITRVAQTKPLSSMSPLAGSEGAFLGSGLGATTTLKSGDSVFASASLAEPAVTARRPLRSLKEMKKTLNE